MTPRQQAIVYEIIDERIQQDSIHGGPEHDDKVDPSTWIDLIETHTIKADSDDISDEIFRRQMIRIAALAIAAIESLDRHHGKGADVGREADMRERGSGW